MAVSMVWMAMPNGVCRQVYIIFIKKGEVNDEETGIKYGFGIGFGGVCPGRLWRRSKIRREHQCRRSEGGYHLESYG